MIRVGMVTTISSEQRCGIAEYSRMLRENIDPDIQITEIGGPYEERRLLPRVLAGNYDIVHFQYESGFLGIFSPGVAGHFRPAKLVLTLHDHWWRDNRKTYPFTDEFDRVVVHQETNEGFVHIPHGIPLMGSLNEPSTHRIGTAGFPLGHKGILLVAFAAALLDKSEPDTWDCTMVCPESPHVDTHITEREVHQIFPRTNYISGWMAQTSVMSVLQGNTVNIFPYRNGKPGISAAVRMGLATGSHMVLSKSTSFMDLWDNPKYVDEIEWIDGDPDHVTPKGIVTAVRRVMESKKKPKKILEDMSWKVAANQYANLYRGLMAGE